MAGVYDPNGNLIYTLVDGNTYVGIYNNNGTFNAVDVTEETDHVGLYHPSGAYNVVIDPTATTYYSDNGSINVVDKGNGTVSPVGTNHDPVLLFDDIASSLGTLYALRKLVTAYTGPCIRVRRSSDNVERDIHFTGYGNLDETTLIEHVGPTGTGYVTTWYSQVGSFHATQTVAAQQPSIMVSGSINRLPNGKPTLRFDGTSDNFTRQSFSLFRNVATGVLAVNASVLNTVSSCYLGLNGTGNGGVRLGLTATANAAFISTVAKRLDSEATTLVTRSMTSGSYSRFIGKARWSAGQADIALNGSVTSGALLSSGSTEDVAANVAPRIGSAYGSAFLPGDINFLMEAAADLNIATLDAKMAQI